MNKLILALLLLLPMTAHAQVSGPGNTFGGGGGGGATTSVDGTTKVTNAAEGFAIGCSATAGTQCTDTNSDIYFDRAGSIWLKNPGQGIVVTPSATVGSGIALSEAGNFGSESFTMKLEDADFPSSTVCTINADGTSTEGCPWASIGTVDRNISYSTTSMKFTIPTPIQPWRTFVGEDSAMPAWISNPGPVGRIGIKSIVAHGSSNIITFDRDPILNSGVRMTIFLPKDGLIEELRGRHFNYAFCDPGISPASLCTATATSFPFSLVETNTTILKEYLDISGYSTTWPSGPDNTKFGHATMVATDTYVPLVSTGEDTSWSDANGAFTQPTTVPYIKANPVNNELCEYVLTPGICGDTIQLVNPTASPALFQVERTQTQLLVGGVSTIQNHCALDVYKNDQQQIPSPVTSILRTYWNSAVDNILSVRALTDNNARVTVAAGTQAVPEVDNIGLYSTGVSNVQFNSSAFVDCNWGSTDWGNSEITITYCPSGFGVTPCDCTTPGVPCT